MKSLILSLVIAVSSIAFAAKQPQMNEAIEQLEHARKARHPIEHLEKAKYHLEHAEHNKGGERVEAINQVNEAIAAARKYEHHRMENHISHAIEDIREGKHKARK